MAQNIGSLEVDVVINNIDSGKVTKQIAEDLKNVETAAKKMATEIDKPKKLNFDLSGLKKEMTNLPKIQKEAVGKLDKIYGENTKQIQALSKELDRVTAKKGDAETVQNLKAEIEARKVLNKEIEKQQKMIEGSSTTARIKEIQREMQRLANLGQDNTEVYRQLMEEAGRLQDIRGDVAAQTAFLADDEGTIKAAASAIGGVKTAADTAKSGMELLGASTTDVTKVMTDLNGVTQIFNGLQAISATLNKDSYARRMASIAATKVQTVVTNLLTKAHIGEAAAAKAATVATAAATAGLTLLIPILYSVITKFREFQKANEDINKGMADAGAPAIVSLELLSQKWNELGDNMEEKRRFVAENQSEFEKLGASVNGVADAEKFLVDGKDTFVATIMARAQATAAYNVLVEKQSELLQEQLNLGTVDANGNFQGNTSWHWGTEGYVNEAMAQTGANRYSDENLKRANELRFQELQREYQEFSNSITNIIKEAEKKIKEGEDELGSVITDKKRTDDYIANLKKQKAVFDNYKASLNSDNQGVKSFFSKELKKLQSEFGTSATTWRQFLEEMKKDPKNVGNYDIIKSINEQLLADNSDPLKELMERQKKNYADYAKLTNSTSAEIRDNAQTVYASLLKQGANYEEFLNNLKEKYKGNAAAIKKINLELIETERQGLMDLFKTDFEREMTLANDVAAQIKVIEATRAAISDDDPLKGQKNAAIDDKIKSLMSGATSDLAGAQKSYNEYLQNLLPERVRYENEVKRLRLMYEAETDEEAAKILNDTLKAAEIRLQMATNKEKIDNAKDLAAQLVRIEEKRASDIEALANDTSLTKAQREAAEKQINDFAQADIEILKAQFNSVDEELIAQITRMTKEASAEQLQQFVTMINQIQEQINGMRERGETDTQAFVELTAKLDLTKAAYERFKTAAQKATKEVAKDKNLKQTIASLSEFGSTLQSLGSQFKGIIGEVMNVTGQMLTSATTIITSIDKITSGTIKDIKLSSTVATTAIRAVETASVILAIIEAAMQVAMALINLFKKDEETYEDKKNVYQAYISTLDTIIDREKKLAETLDAQRAIVQYDAIGENIRKQEESTRRIADEYMHEGTKGKKNNRGTKRGTAMGEKMNSQDWAELAAAGITTIKNKYDVKDKLFDLPTEQLIAIQEKAVGFYSKLDDETRGYIEDIIKYSSSAADLEMEKWEQFNGISFDGFSDNFESALEEIGASAEDITANIKDQMRRALIQDMYKKDYAAALDDYYKKWGQAMQDGTLTDAEKRSLDQLADSIAQGATQAAAAINERFETQTEEIEEKGLSGAIKNASQESIDLLTGQTNAVRMNQIEAIEINRQQLNAVLNINATLIICRDYLATISGAVTTNQLRAQGVTEY
jgi:hypothetical protein